MSFEFGDKVMWVDRKGNPHMGIFHHDVNEHHGVVMVGEGLVETHLKALMTKVTPLLELAGDGEVEEQPTFNFEAGDRVEWLDADGNLCDGEFRYPYVYNQRYGIVWRDAGHVTQVPLADLRPAEDKPAPTPPTFKKGDIVTWEDSDGETQFGTYYRLFGNGHHEVMTEPGVHTDVPGSFLKLAPKPELKRGDRVTWWKSDGGGRREGEFSHENSVGCGVVFLSRTVETRVPMHKLQKVD